jgi:hypothetical protein
MVRLKKTLAGLALVAGVGLASPSFAQTRQDHPSARELGAIHDCSIRARKEYPREYTDETNNYYAYRACMGERGFTGD